MKPETLENAKRKFDESLKIAETLRYEFDAVRQLYPPMRAWILSQPKPAGWDERQHAYRKWYRAHKEMKKCEYYLNRMAKKPCLSTDPDNPLLDITETARTLAISRSQVYQMIRDNELPFVSKPLRVPLNELKAWISTHSLSKNSQARPWNALNETVGDEPLFVRLALT